MLLVFARRRTRRRSGGGQAADPRRLFEIRLFNDDLRAMLRAQVEILRHNVTYLRLSLVPMLWMLVPLVLVIAQLQFHYGYAASPRTARARQGSPEGGGHSRVRRGARHRARELHPASACRQRSSGFPLNGKPRGASAWTSLATMS